MENRPDHYDSGIEPVEFIESNDLGFNLGNAVKYIARNGKKAGQSKSEDLTKALWYVGRELTQQDFQCIDYEGPSVTLIGIDGKIVPEVNLPGPPQFTGTDGEKLLEFAGRVCYDSFGKPKSRPTADYLEHIVESRHTSVLGHGVLHFTGTEYELQRFAWTFISEPGWYIDPGNVLTINLRFVERVKSQIFKLYPEVWNAFHQAYPLVITYRCPKATDPRLRLYTEPGKHQWVTFLIRCSRSCSHEFIRHSYQSAISQRSTRYVDESDYKALLHPLFFQRGRLFSKFSRDVDLLVILSRLLYKNVVKKAEQELVREGVDSAVARKAARGAAARFLPHALPTQIVYSASLYEWDEIFKQRISPYADQEIKTVATDCKVKIDSIINSEKGY